MTRQDKKQFNYVFRKTLVSQARKRILKKKKKILLKTEKKQKPPTKECDILNKISHLNCSKGRNVAERKRTGLRGSQILPTEQFSIQPSGGWCGVKEKVLY